MREIVNLQIGDEVGHWKGIEELGCTFLDNIAAEHGLDNSGLYNGNSGPQLEKIGVYFNEISKSKYVPRSIFANCSPSLSESLSCRQQPYNPKNIIQGNDHIGNNWAKGYYTDGAELVDQVMDAVRREVEDCDCLQGFQMVHSIGDGCGGGLGSLILEKIRDEIGNDTIATISLVPRYACFSGDITWPYNAGLTLDHIHQLVDMSFFLHTTTLEVMAYRLYQDTKIGYKRASYALSGVTSTFRFPGQINSDLRRLYMNMVPSSPRLSYLSLGSAPIFTGDVLNGSIIQPEELVWQTYDEQQMMTALDYSRDDRPRSLAFSANFRGNVSMRAVESEMSLIKQRRMSEKPTDSRTALIDWMPDTGHISYSPIPTHRIKSSSTYFGNFTSIRHTFSTILSSFEALSKRKSYYRFYVEEGLDEMEFVEAQSCLSDLDCEYEMAERWG